MLPELETLAERFTWARKQIDGLSQTKLAKDLGVSQQSIEKLENGHVVKPKYLPEAAKRLNVPYNWLHKGTKITWEEEAVMELRKFDENARSSFVNMLKTWHKNPIP